MESPTLDGSRRALRYSMALPLKYRAGGVKRWSDAVTLNLSRTGALLRPAGDLPPGGRVDIILSLPACDAFPGARVRCVALVVRVGRDAIALRFERYRFLKPQEDEAADGLWESQ